MWEFAQYGQDLKDLNNLVDEMLESSGIVWKRSEDNKQYSLYVDGKLVNDKGVTFWVDNHLYVYLTELKKVYFLENFKTLAANTYHNGELLDFTPAYGIWYKVGDDKVILYNSDGKKINEVEFFKYAANGNAILKGKNEKSTLLLENFKNAPLNKVYSADVYNPINNGCLTGDCLNGFGKKEYENGDKFEGDFKNGFREGKGIYIFANGNKYVGNWLNNRFEGEGILTTKDGVVQKGSFLKGRMHGKGSIIQANGDIFVGNFKNGLKHGEATIYNYSTGEEIVCFYENHKRVKTISTSNINVQMASNTKSSNTKVSGFQKEIEGCKNLETVSTCLANKIVDKYNSLKNSGITEESIHLQLAKDFKAVGNYKIDVLFDMIMDLNPSILPEEKYNKILANLSAEQRADLRAYALKKVDNYAKKHSGSQKLKSNTEIVVSTKKEGSLETNIKIGCVSGDCENGKGTYVWENKSMYIGDWLNGVRTGKGTYKWNTGSEYIGDFINAKRQGKGVMLFSDGGKYEGDWFNNNREGKGVYIWPNGQKYIGEWSQDKIHGMGKEYNPKGELVFEGQYDNGKRYKQMKVTD